MSYASPAMNLPDPDTQPEFYAGVATKRLLAFVVDMVVVFVLALIALPFTFFSGLFFFPVLMAILGFIYRVTTIAGGSATWGMRLMAIELRDASGNRFDFSTALLHTAGYYVSIAVAPLQLISVVMMVATPRGQGLSDMVLGSVMLNRRSLRA
ncbi:RDD family protein [Aquicoccus sp. SCR17]|nr:RDD family protein [Carideicomes alvinocaridis]